MTPADAVARERDEARKELADLRGDDDAWRRTYEKTHAALLKAEADAAQLREALERDALRARAETAERDLDIARGLIARLGDPDSLESLWALLRYERARVAELERAQDAAFRDAHRAEADAARLREALTQVRDAMLATGQGPDGDDDPRRPVAAAVWRALASAPSAETWRQVGQHAAHPELDAEAAQLRKAVKP